MVEITKLSNASILALDLPLAGTRVLPMGERLPSLPDLSREVFLVGEFSPSPSSE